MAGNSVVKNFLTTDIQATARHLLHLERLSPYIGMHQDAPRNAPAEIVATLSRQLEEDTVLTTKEVDYVDAVDIIPVVSAIFEIIAKNILILRFVK